MPIPELRLESWLRFVAIVDKLSVGSPLRDLYSFRGQAHDWPLIPFFARIARQMGWTDAQALLVEREALERFRQDAHLYVHAPIVPRDLVSWWTLMQHYGAPTRLLDWTASPYVAAYFAVESRPDSDGVVWVLYGRRLVDSLKEKHGHQTDFPTDFPSDQDLFRRQDAPAILYMLQAGSLTDRMGAQQTGFSVCLRVLEDHSEIIQDAIGSETAQASFKIVVPAALKPTFLRRLRAMNIQARSMFPGIDGVGRSIRELVMLSGDGETLDNTLLPPKASQ